MIESKFETIIGLEIHAQLKTQSKIFSADRTDFGGADNDHVSYVSAGFPGTLPVLNAEVVELGIKAGLALNCHINSKSIFARKNYFYPDLPKGYQISQYEKPVCENGYIEFIHNNQRKKVNIVRAHLEEDAGKSMHQGGSTLLNYNRAGVPLLEIVSAPEIRSGSEAAEYANQIRTILRYIDACDGNLEEGSLRCDCNVSVRPLGETQLGTKVEIKNINSFRFIEKAIEYESERQIDAILNGEKILQETRLYDSDKNRTFSMRSKEDAQDYRYFPDPDLPALRISEEKLNHIRKNLPEMPLARWDRYIKAYGLTEQDCSFLVSDREVGDYFEQGLLFNPQPKSFVNWMMGEMLAFNNENGLNFSNTKMNPERLAGLVKKVDSGQVSHRLAKDIFRKMIDENLASEAAIAALGIEMITDHGSIESAIVEILLAHPSQVREYHGGKQKVFSFFLGQVMKKTKGQASPTVANEILTKELNKLRHTFGGGE